MSHQKNKKDLLDDAIKKDNLDYYFDSVGEYEYDSDYYEWFSDIVQYEYDDDFYKNGRMIDLDSISINRKRESLINSILGEDGKTRIGDFYGK